MRLLGENVGMKDAVEPLRHSAPDLLTLLQQLKHNARSLASDAQNSPVGRLHVSQAEAGEQFHDLPFHDRRQIRHRQLSVQPCGRSRRTPRCGCQANAQSAMAQKPAPT